MDDTPETTPEETEKPTPSGDDAVPDSDDVGGGTTGPEQEDTAPVEDPSDTATEGQQSLADDGEATVTDSGVAPDAEESPSEAGGAEQTIADGDEAQDGAAPPDPS